MPAKADDQQQLEDNEDDNEQKPNNNNDSHLPLGHDADGATNNHNNNVTPETTGVVAMPVDAPLPDNIATKSRLAADSDESADPDQRPAEPPTKRLRGSDGSCPLVTPNDLEQQHQQMAVDEQQLEPEFNELRRVGATSTTNSGEDLDCIARSVTDHIVSQVSLDNNNS